VRGALEAKKVAIEVIYGAVKVLRETIEVVKEQ